MKIRYYELYYDIFFRDIYRKTNVKACNVPAKFIIIRKATALPHTKTKRIIKQYIILLFNRYIWKVNGYFIIVAYINLCLVPDVLFRNKLLSCVMESFLRNTGIPYY